MLVPRRPFWRGFIHGGLALAWTFSQGAAPPRPELVVPLRIHLMQALEKPEVQTTLTDEDVQRILAKANGIWSQAGIRFTLESLVHEEANVAAAHPESDSTGKDRWLLDLIRAENRAGQAFNVYFIKTMQPNGYWSHGVVFVKDTAKLKPVEGGLDEPLPRVMAHELGHALGLPHRQDVTNLMASGTNGFSLNEAEIATTRQTATHLPWMRIPPPP